MANVIGLSQYHEDNLRKLAAYLLGGELKADFDMSRFSSTLLAINKRRETHCGTAGCAAGHGPYAGIPKNEDESWEEYIIRVFGMGNEINYYYSWCFAGEWADLDNTPEGAAKRILWLLDNGLPDNAADQCNRRAPLCYL